MFDSENKLLENEIKSLIKPYSPSITNELGSFLFAKSKRIRSRLIFLFVKAFSKKADENVIKLSAAVELLHAATLIHDDVIDCASFRRGIKTFNAKFDSKYAVLIGDLILTLVNKELLKLNNSEILEIFSCATSDLCLGELEQYKSKGKNLTFEEYIKKSKSKTSSIFIAALHSLGVLLGDNVICPQLIDFASNFGIAFQIRDDLMNFIGTDKMKPVMNDFENGIYSASVLFYLQQGGQLENFCFDFANNQDLKNKIITLTCDMIKTYSDNAVSALNIIKANTYKLEIEKLCENLWRLP